MFFMHFCPGVAYNGKLVVFSEPFNLIYFDFYGFFYNFFFKIKKILITNPRDGANDILIRKTSYDNVFCLV